MSTIIYLIALAGLLCSAISIGYSFSHDQRSRRMAGVWLRRMFVCAAGGMVLVYIGGAR